MDNEVEAWSEMPLWIPDKMEMAGFLSVNIDKAINQGLKFRPISETVRDTLDWDSARTGLERKAGMDPEKEKELLEKWDGETVS